MHPELSILRVPAGSDLFELAAQLRRRVFIEEQQVPEADEWDGRDQQAGHWVALYQGNLVGTLRVLWLEPHVKLGRFAIRKDCRGRGFGQALFRQVLMDLQTAGRQKFFLEAQMDRIHFYQHYGFTTIGEPYMDAGILHQAMQNY